MIPHAIVSRSVSRAISAETTVDERASIPCLRHHGYASASQIVSKPPGRAPRGLEHLVERLHRELHHADAERRRHRLLLRRRGAVRLRGDRFSSAPSTWLTCCFTIGCSTRWPIEPTGPATERSAAQSIARPRRRPARA